MSESEHSPERTDEEPSEHAVRIPVVGERIGKYIVLEGIGSGAMGVVVRAYDPHLERSVAIKVVRPRALDPGRTEASRARLLAEARALARISDPHVIAVYEVGLHDGLIYVAMELIDGVDLQRWLRLARRSWREIVEAFAAAGRGLAAVHDAGLVHRDVKPANILVGSDGRVRIGDFGIARASFEVPAPKLDGHELGADGFDLETTALTIEGRVVGTPAYMAPEQHVGAEVGPAADQFALCVGLYEALWGKRPFVVDARRMLAAKRAGPIDPGTKTRVPRWLFTVVARGLAADPAARYASMNELCAALAVDRSQRRRRRIALGLGGVATLGAGALLVRLAMRPGPCENTGAALAGVWDPPTRAAVEQVFARSDRPWAAPAWVHAAPRLDQYAEAWTAMRRDACEATHVRGEQSADLLDRRMTCLEARRRGLAAATELFLAGEQSAIDHTFELVGRLRPIAPCADVIALASAVELPDDPGLRAEVASVRTSLARARAMIDAGRYADALALAQSNVSAARGFEYPPVLAETLAFEGEALLRAGGADDARIALEGALWTAIAVGHDEVAAEAASSLVWVAGQHARSLPEALRWGELARASLRHGGREDPQDLVQLENALGAAYDDAAQYDDALRMFEAALARIADDPALVARAATLRHNIAKMWVDRGELGRARAILEPTIAELAAVIGPGHPRVVSMRGSLGQIFGAAGDHEQAAALFRSEVEGLTIAMGKDALAVANARSNLGVALADLGRSDEAIAVMEEALAVFERMGEDNHAATSLNNLGSELLKRKIYDAAESRFSRAVALLDATYPDGHPNLSEPLVGLGRVRMAQGRFADALVLFERADRLVRESAGLSAHMRGLALDGRVAALAALDRPTEALALVVSLIDILRTAGDAEPPELPAALLRHAELLCESARFAEAVAAIDEALALARARGLADEIASAARLRALAAKRDCTGA